MKNRKLESAFNVNVIENHGLLYMNLPKKIISDMELTDTDVLEYDVRLNQFFCRKKGTTNSPTLDFNHLFSGLKVERTITRNNTVLRTNLPKEVTLSLDIEKGDFVEIILSDKVLIGKKLESK